ncbi:MAG: molybdopterin-dependent oxidoreductase [Planctomycetes bacterium]|nr:molybdopterin-dependent oxidoreductase [Planctomycetota bacterium]
MAYKPQKRPWLEWLPFGVGAKKPRHFRDMGRILWQNRDSLPRAWRVLTRGVCDGCALGTTGLKDWTVKGTHLCMVRLELLRLNTMGALKGEVWRDVSKLKLMTSRELRELGRIPYPLRRRKGEAGFSRVSWDEAMAGIGEHWKKTDPLKAAMFVTSRGVTNEVYYAAQKVSRFLGSPHIDNSARLCHSPSTAGLKRTVGIAATTCSYLDWYEADVIIFIGSNPANDQPVSTKYLAEAKRGGARILEVNAFREPGMKRYWVPSDARSAVFGTDIVDRSFQVKVGGDLAFFCAVQKNLLAHGGSLAEQFIEESTQDFKEFKDALMELEEAALLQQAGVTSEEIEDFAEEVRRAGNGVLVWSMGVTQHIHGADTVASIANLGLLKGWMGRNGCGLMPIRGHSGVQGGAEMGAYATALPGGLPITEETAQQFSELWGFQVPPQEGWSCVDSLEQAQQGNLDAFWCIGGNFLETMPRPERIQKGLENINIRVHTDLF